MSEDSNREKAGEFSSEPAASSWTPAQQDLLKRWRGLPRQPVLSTSDRLLGSGVGTWPWVFPSLCCPLWSRGLYSSSKGGGLGALPILVLAIISVLVSVLASLMVFGAPVDREPAHRNAAEMFAAVRREIDETSAIPPASAEEANKILESIASRLDEVAAEAPEFGERAMNLVPRSTRT